MVDVDSDQQPDFIYGGPFIRRARPEPLVDTITPRNVQLRAIWQRSFAYHTVRERLPIIITKVIDYLSREKDTISQQCGASSDELVEAIQYCTKLKNDITTNKRLEQLDSDTEEAKRWNEWIAAEDQPYYFTAVWVFTECYVYRRLREAFVHNEHLKNFDPFQHQKDEAYKQNVEAMSSVATRLDSMVQGDNVKESLAMLLKLALWANKCDLSLSVGSQLDTVVDPVRALADYKDKLLVDDAAKVADFVVEKSAALAKEIEETNFANMKCSCNRLATACGMKTVETNADDQTGATDAEVPGDVEETEEQEKPPCPTKMTVASSVMFDIVCDNAGYELFTDLCIGHFLLAKGIVKKVRYHVKEIPWFVSDVTRRDFQHVIDSCAKAEFSKEVQPEPGAEEGAAPGVVNSDDLKALGAQLQDYVRDGSFVVEADSFWTSPHVYKDMKKIDPALYRKLQFPVCVLFKGDLNYRKLIGEMNWNPTTSFEQALQGFTPAPLAAVRTVKADLVCGLPKGKAEQLTALDEKWMEKGDYGVIQFCPKKEALKVSDRPCAEFGNTCNGAVC